MTEFVDSILSAIEYTAKQKRDAEFPFRHHLGASIIGHPCERYLFYSFRWVQTPDHSSRLLRIFERGHEEELRIINKLREIGLVISTDNGHGEQIRANDLPAHIGGSLDAMLHVPANLVERYGQYMPIEVKTHNHANFGKTFKRGINESHPQHYTQGNTYGWSWNTSHFMYVGLNKNDDSLGIQIHEVVKESASVHVTRGRNVVYTQDARLVSRTDERWRCKMCDYADKCKNKLPATARNCRSCVNAQPMQDGTWICNRMMVAIPKYSEIHMGEACDEWVSII